MHRAIPRDEGLARLIALGWRYQVTLNDEVEVWVRAGIEIGVTPEADGSGDYAERLIEMIEDAG